MKLARQKLRSEAAKARRIDREKLRGEGQGGWEGGPLPPELGGKKGKKKGKKVKVRKSKVGYRFI